MTDTPRCIPLAAPHTPVLRRALLMLPLFAGGIAQTDAAQRSLDRPVVRDTVLSNGLTVIAVHNPVIPAATIELAFRNGAFTQRLEEEEGLPHLMEHMFFKSFGGGGFSERAGNLDASYNGTTGVETVTYYLVVPARNWAKAVELLARTARLPDFPQNELALEKRRVANELERRAADPEFLLDFHMSQALWGSAFRQKNIGGNLFAVLGATSDALMAHYRRWYVPNNAALIVTGDVSPEEVFKAAGSRFASWKRTGDPFEAFAHPPILPLQRDSIVVVEADAPDVTLAVAWQGPSERNDSAGAAAGELFSAVVTQRVSGAYHRLVDSGLFQSLSMSYENSNHVGAIKLVARTVPEQVVAASSALSEEIARMGRGDYFAADDLDAARMSLRVDRARSRESAISSAHILARDWSLDRYARTWREGHQMYDVGVEEVRAYVSRYIAGRPKVLTMMVSSATIDEHSATLMASLTPWGVR